jgi:hypothetical protein
MAYTIEQYNALVEGISTGALRVKYGDKEVEYRSLNDMLLIKAKMEVELGLVQRRSRRLLTSFTKGLS